MQKWDVSTYTVDWHDSFITKPKIETLAIILPSKLDQEGLHCMLKILH